MSYFIPINTHAGQVGNDMNTTATPIVTNARPVAAARSASTASVAATAVSAAPDNNKKPRFKWKFKIRDKEFDSKTKEAKLVYPFLDNTNEQDFLLTQLILKKAPYKALNNTGGAWKELNDTLAKTKAKDGSLPFAYIGGKTARNRFNEYKELAEYWSDKTGPERPVTPENVEDIIGANEGYSQRIIDAVENIFEEIASMAEEKKNAAKAATDKENVEKHHVDVLKAHALGTFKSPMCITPFGFAEEDTLADDVECSLPPAGSSRSNNKALGRFDPAALATFGGGDVAAQCATTPTPTASIQKLKPAPLRAPAPSFGKNGAAAASIAPLSTLVTEMENAKLKQRDEKAKLLEEREKRKLEATAIEKLKAETAMKRMALDTEKLKAETEEKRVALEIKSSYLIN